ncbi:protein yippee-like At3g08990 [Solanum lycopersicum]|uniref:Yippee domain-containing protein n=1 Tax=Solanum lycopersicum TaxID=4081 RepID=K4C9T5_SOLLC|nr:protein yippee-like At3g08990 [Solanum lycopersicum]
MAIRMGQNLPQSNHVPSDTYFYCCGCGAHVVIISYIPATRVISQMYLCRFGVIEAVNEPQHRVIHGMNLTVAESFCFQCRNLLGWKILAVLQPSTVYRVGGSILRMNAVVSWNNETLFDFLYGGNNEQAPNDQDGGAVEEQVGNANEQNADLGGNGGVNEQVPNEAVDIIEGLGNIDLNANI